MGTLMFALLTHPEVLDRVRSDEQALGKTVDELLRWETPVAVLPRLTLTGGELAGAQIPPRSMILFGITGANHDPEIFSHPDEFDIDRDTKAKLTFGLGSHSCPGLHLARTEMIEGTRVLLERLPGLRLEDEEVAQPRGFALRGSQSLPVSFRPGS
jgi:cytochrome P450